MTIRTELFTCHRHPSLGPIDWCPKCSCGEASDATIYAMVALDKDPRFATLTDDQRESITRAVSQRVQRKIDAGSLHDNDPYHFAGCAVDDAICGPAPRDELLSSRDEEWT